MTIEQDAKQVVKDVAAAPEAAVVATETKATSSLAALVAKYPNTVAALAVALGAGGTYVLLKLI